MAKMTKSAWILVLSFLAVVLIGYQGVKAEVDEPEIPTVEDEPYQTDEVNNEPEQAVQDEPINEPDQTDDVASADEPQDDSADYSSDVEEETGEPLSDLDASEEPQVFEEEEEGFYWADEYDHELLDDEFYDDEDESLREKRATTKKPAATTKKPVATTKKPVATTKKPVATTKKPALPPAYPTTALAYDNPKRCYAGAAVRGPCKSNIKRYHYNPTTNKCDSFTYSGCGGNENNWVYLGNCVDVCVKKPPPPKQPPLKWNDPKRCVGPIVKGNCKASIKRFHYNAATDTCEPFTWTGCDNTPNNWWYVKNCQKVCVKKKPAPPVKWNDPIRCQGPEVRGPCDKNIRRYHYNAATNKCEPFIFGGCKGNHNNWWYKKNCEKICVKSPPQPPAKLPWNDKRRCEGPEAPGDCTKKIQRFHYDAAKDQCLPFTYTGCGGNNNNWWHRANCQKICLRKKLAWDDPNRCKGPVVRGPCNKNIRRYHYNSVTGKCEPFSYGGCGGNDNNWWYKKNCEKICVKGTSEPEAPKPKWDDPVRCQGSLDVGICTGSEQRYHYDGSINLCVPFNYTGCGGNDNNWWYINNCRKVCVTSDEGGDSSGTNGFGGLGFIEGPAQCVADDGTVEEKIPQPCPLVADCTKRCRYGFKSDDGGCPTCECGQLLCAAEN